MYKFILILIFILYFYTPPLISQTIPSLSIVITEDVYRDYLCLLNNQDVLAVKDYGGKCSRREVVEIILIQQMLALGGFQYQFILEPEYYNMRERQLIKKGLLLINVDSVWQSEAQTMAKDVYISAPLIRKGEYQAGFYTSADNSKILSINSVEQIKKMSVISNKKWTIDWKSLMNAGFVNMRHEEEWMTQATLVKNHFMDAMLIPFANSDDLSYKINNIVLAPIPNFIFPLPESRHVIISRLHPLGEKTYKALLKGMKIMRSKGTITKAFTDSGLFNPKVKHWQKVD